jgi:hypothetical protein
MPAFSEDALFTLASYFIDDKASSMEERNKVIDVCIKMYQV